MIDFYVEIGDDRMWRLIVTKAGVETECFVAARKVGPLVDDLTADPSVRGVRCAPMRATVHEGVWMASRAAA
jgi:hypothetical protein